MRTIKLNARKKCVVNAIVGVVAASAANFTYHCSCTIAATLVIVVVVAFSFAATAATVATTLDVVVAATA